MIQNIVFILLAGLIFVNVLVVVRFPVTDFHSVHQHKIQCS